MCGGCASLKRASPLSLRGHGQASDCEREPHGVGLAGLAQVVAGDHRDPSESIAHGVGMDEQDPGRGLETTTAVEIGRGCLEQGFAGRGQRTIDPVDHGSTSCCVTGQNTLDQQLDLERDLQDEAGHTPDYAEGVRAFAEKRPPVFTGRR